MSVTSGPTVGISYPSEASGFHGDYVRGRPAALAFLPRHPSHEDDWETRLAEVLDRPPASDVWRRAAADAECLGADDASVANANALAKGRVLCVTTGQQPGLFLGPLYSIYKAMTAVALARRLSEKTGTLTVPVFWNAADDSDFGEVGSAFLAGEDFRLAQVKLDGGDLPAGGMVGHLSIDGTRQALADAHDVLHNRPAELAIRKHLERAMELASDHGELTTALLYDLLRGTGIVIVDGRWPELRTAAAPLFERYAGQRERIAEAVNAQGKALEDAGYRARITEASAEHALFEIKDVRRLPFGGDDGELARRIADAPETLSPNVLLRPVVQDALFPNVATVGGPGEISYHAQLTPVYERLDVSMPILFPRFEATILPPRLQDLAERRGAPLEDFVRDFDGTMKATASAALPADLREGLEELEATLATRIGILRERAIDFEPKLGGSVDEVERRVREALRKLEEKAAKAAKAEEKKHDPAIGAYREFLRPRGVPQERVLSALALFLESTVHPLECLEGALTEHLEASRDARPLHWLLPLHGCGGEGA